MDKVKASVKDFTSRAGHHDTTVHETVAPSVQHETVKPHQHEEINTAVDKEVHQDHYHRTVQPVSDREVLPEKHTANLGAVQHREFDNRDHEGTKRHLAEGQQQFRDQQAVHDTTHSQSMSPTVGGEHVHHHVHETIQPVVHKETVQPNVVHTTVPIHETHHNAAKHHNTSELPAVTMDQFKGKGGVLGGREERYDGFEGEPRNIGGNLSSGGIAGTHSKHDSHHASDALKHKSGHGDYESDPMHRRGDGSGTSAGALAGAGAGAAGAGLASGHEHGQHGHHHGAGTDRTLDSERSGLGSDRSGLGSDRSGLSSNERSGLGAGQQSGLRSGERTAGGLGNSGNVRGVEESTGGPTGTGDGNHPASRLSDRDVGNLGKQSSAGGIGAGVGSRNQDSTLDNTTSNTQPKKSGGFMDKLNPMTDSNGDGQKGFMK